MSQTMTKPTPSFRNPPLHETVLSVQFQPLGWDNITIAQLWLDTYRDKYPQTAEHGEIPPQVEQFGVRPGVPGLKLEMKEKPGVPRYWFINQDGSQLVQIQKDRFIRNWRKPENGASYPRYPTLRDAFFEDFQSFKRFAGNRPGDEVLPHQCEVTYVNHIPEGEGWDSWKNLSEVLTVWQPQYTESFLPPVEDITLAMRHIIPGATGEPIGRLHITAEPAYRRTDLKPMLRLTLTARGEPLEGTDDGVRAFFDLAHEWIVWGFASVTQPKMHKLWERVI